MTKSELILRLVKKYPNLRTLDIEKFVNTVFEKISQTLEEEGRVELRGFGAFATKERKERIGRNPRTGESVKVPSHHVVAFRSGKALYEKMNSEYS